MTRSKFKPWLWTLLLWLAALIVTVINLAPSLKGMGFVELVSTPSPEDSRAVLAHYSLLPRLAIACISGFALGLSGMLFQHVLRNPLASPSTLGVEAGAQLALGVAMLWFPALLGWDRDVTTALGGFAAMGIVSIVAWKFNFQPVVVILAGMVTGLYCTALVTLIVLMNDHYLAGLFIWGGGSLNQNDWRQVTSLLPKIALSTLIAFLLVRQLTLLSLGEAAQGLGVKLQFVRAGAFAVAVALTTFVVSAVGIIGFLGLAAPAIARAIGARRIGDRMILAPLIGAALLVIIDQLVQIYGTRTGIALPTGAVTALVGAPALLILMLRRAVPLQSTTEGRSILVASRHQGVLLAILLLLLVAAFMTLFVGRDVNGAWASQSGAMLEQLLPWRLPRLVAATSAGVMLALAGSMLQRLTGNAMASPEVLGVSAGTAFGLLCVLYMATEPTYLGRLTGGFSGGAAVLVLLFLMGGNAKTGNRFLILGVSLGALLTSLVSIILASGDPRAISLISWMAGSTYGVNATTAVISLAFALVGIGGVMLFVRPLQQFALGEISAHSRGVDIRIARLMILGFSALLTAIGTLVVGPLSFVGLMAPHLAQRLGLIRGAPHLAGSALIGALLMAVADFIGRTGYFPWQLPSGLIATLLGGPVFAVLLLHSRRQIMQH